MNLVMIAIRWAAVRGHVEVVKLLLQDPRVDPSDDNDDALLPLLAKYFFFCTPLVAFTCLLTLPLLVLVFLLLFASSPLLITSCLVANPCNVVTLFSTRWTACKKTREIHVYEDSSVS